MNAMTTLLGLVSTQVGKPEGEDWKTRCKEYVKLVDPEAPEITFSWDTGEKKMKSSQSFQASNRAITASDIATGTRSNTNAQASNARKTHIHHKPRGVRKLTSMEQLYLPKWVKFLQNIRPTT